MVSINSLIGKSNDNEDADLVKEVGKYGAMVMRLMQPLLGKGYHLFVDKWYLVFFTQAPRDTRVAPFEETASPSQRTLLKKNCLVEKGDTYKKVGLFQFL